MLKLTTYEKHILGILSDFYSFDNHLNNVCFKKVENKLRVRLLLSKLQLDAIVSDLAILVGEGYSYPVTDKNSMFKLQLYFYDSNLDSQISKWKKIALKSFVDRNKAYLNFTNFGVKT